MSLPPQFSNYPALGQERTLAVKGVTPKTLKIKFSDVKEGAQGHNAKRVTLDMLMSISRYGMALSMTA